MTIAREFERIAPGLRLAKPGAVRSDGVTGLFDEARTIARPVSGVVQVADARQAIASSPLSGTHDLVKLGVIAEGGMGSVLLGHQTSLSRDVAIKTTKPDATATEIAALMREALVTGALEHPSIVPVHALEKDENGRPLLVMKRVEGVSWLTLLRDPSHPAWRTHLDEGRDSLGANLDVLISICRALELAHLRGIIHCDIKPSNVMLGRFGEVYLVDWGLATPTGAKAGGLVGTPSYMAPEMVAGDVVDERTDVYLLGATLHRVLTGHARHAGEELMDTLVAASVSAPFGYPGNVPAALGELCNVACAAAKEDRLPSVAAFRAALVDFRRRRGALAIGDVAGDRLAQLEEMLARPSDLALAYRLATEARFGFAQALAQCPDLEEACEGATRSLEALVNLELSRGHVDTAEALLEEAPPESVERLRPRLEILRRALAEKKAEEARLRSLALDLDPTIGSRSRVFVLLGLLVVEVVLAMFLEQLTAWGFAAIAIFVLIATLGGVAIGRRRLLANVFGRRIVGLLVFCELAACCNRVLGAWRHQSLIETISADLLLFSGMTGVGALLLVPRLAATLPIFLGALVVTQVWPQYAPIVYPWTFTICLGLAMWAIHNPSKLTRA